MAANRDPARRRRARRGSLERPVNARLYRGSFLFLSLPLLILAFSIVRPGRCRRRCCRRTSTAARRESSRADFATAYPDRSPGGPARCARSAVVPRPDGAVRPAGLDRHLAATIAGLGTVRLRNVWAVAAGQSPQAIVVMAHRDDTGRGPGANDNATGTAALVELARNYAQAAGGRVRSAHTIVFLSTDGGAFGGLGAVRFAEHSPFRVVATINLDAIGGAIAAC